ncbi:uncharacterized protein FOMMEDRAFT_90383 [Fomitiporia mediterranea MF3/22]|uniref:uncharacterized protein n=1 Tax=Fomitiporia mediterranea (strain MF3/22) TaxID=694068 RepID=UPI0004409251|nr:uncharacterized protein FOMMEDRAFT_90383 [Fomitiporia mediterranea MF3/22]EJD01694.1 hypothetical protein FOMMEDRAFT_90383 [Fomitiporia mediterranea MF3/22]
MSSCPSGLTLSEACLSSSNDTDSDSDYDSLFDGNGDFDEPPSSRSTTDIEDVVQKHHPASRSAPPIPGLYLDPTVLIPSDIANRLWTACMGMYFKDGTVNQIMLFERARSAKLEGEPINRLPPILLELLDTLEKLLKDVVPPDVHALLFPSTDESGQARQVILNHYRPGEGITPHVDLLKRYGDGIIEPFEIPPESHAVYLPERSVIVLTEEARYTWTHGISKRVEDEVESLDGCLSESLPRGERLSITYRWLLPGADVVGA